MNLMAYLIIITQLTNLMADQVIITQCPKWHTYRYNNVLNNVVISLLNFKSHYEFHNSAFKTMHLQLYLIS